MARCLVTGGAGFIGSRLASFLVSQGHEVLVIDDLSGGDKESVPPSVRFASQALEDVNSELFEQVDVIFHLASIAAEAASLFAPSACFLRNVAAGHNLILNALRSRVQRVVFASSMAVYGRDLQPPFTEDDRCIPADPYGLSKLTIESLLQIYSDHSPLEWTSLRLHNVYGPGMNLLDPYRGVVSIFLNRILRGKPPIVYGDGSQLRAFTYIDDLVPCIAKAGFDVGCAGQIINLGSGRTTSVRELAATLLELTGLVSPPIHLPTRPGEAKDAFTSTRKAAELLGWKDTTHLQDGLSQTLEWAKKKGVSSFNYELIQIELDLDGRLPISWRDRLL